MKKFIFTLAFFSVASMASAQFTVRSNGETATGNTRINGMLGTGNLDGVLTLEAYNRHATISDTINPGIMLSIKQSFGASPITVYNTYESNRINYRIDLNGFVYSSGNVTLSDSTCKMNIQPLLSPLAKLKNLQGVSFNYKYDQNKPALTAIEQATLGATPEIGHKIAGEQGGRRIGLLAQDVEKVFPEAVRTMYDGSKGVIYEDLVAVLVEALKEMQDSVTAQAARMESYQQQLNALQAFVYTANQSALSPSSPQARAKASGNEMGQGEAELKQNVPNPFNRTTTIAYRLPSEASRAAICIYNLNGVQLKQYPADTSLSEGEITIEASTFTPGMYIYALIIDGRLSDAKRMVVTE